MREDLYAFDELIQYSEDFYELECEALRNKYNKAKDKALKCREDYSKMCDKFKRYFLIGMGIIFLYNFTIKDFLTGYKNTLPEMFYNIIIIAGMLWKWGLGFPYFIFLVKKLWDIYIEGKGVGGRWLANKMSYKSLTILAEEYDNEALYLENQLKEVEKKRLDFKRD